MGERDILIEHTTEATTQKKQSLLMEVIFAGEGNAARLQERLFAGSKK